MGPPHMSNMEQPTTFSPQSVTEKVNVSYQNTKAPQESLLKSSSEPNIEKHLHTRKQTPGTSTDSGIESEEPPEVIVDNFIKKGAHMHSTDAQPNLKSGFQF